MTPTMPTSSLFHFLLRLMVFGFCFTSAVCTDNVPAVNDTENTSRVSTQTLIYGIGVTKQQSETGSSIQPLSSNGSSNTIFQTHGSEDSEPLWKEGRLPEFALPIRCHYIFQPDLQNLILKGRAIIEIRIVQATSSLVFNGRRVKIDELRLTQRGMGHTILATENNVVYIPERDQILVQSSQTLKPDSIVILNMKFRSNITTDVLDGLSVANYTAARREQSTPVVSTQLEPTSARRMIPCWDEPAFKVRFRISIIRPARFFALSNMPLLRTTLLDRTHRLERDDFMETYPMSTYSLAIVLALKSGYSFIEEPAGYDTGRGLERPRLRLYAPIEQLQRGRLAFESARGSSRYFTKLFQLQIAVPKIDMLPLPKHISGATENVGLHTYQLDLLLADERDSAERDKEDVLTVVAHEVSHEWIGNRATPEWWTEVWLKEGASQFLQSLAGNALRPDWGLIDQMYYDLNTFGMKDDVLPSTRPLSVPRNSSQPGPLDISDIYNDIPYSKGGAIWRMISSKDFFGFGLVTKGLSGLIRRFTFRTFNATDLIFELGKHASIGQEAFKNFMQTWVYQEGLPYVKVTSAGNTLTLRQRRFKTADCASNPSLETNPTTSTLNEATGVGRPDHVWQILITCSVYYHDGRSDTVKVWVKTADPVNVELKGTVQFIKCNRQGRGYYRVLYSNDLLTALIQVLKQHPTRLHRLDRASLLSDYMAFPNLKDEPVTPGVSHDVLKAILPHETDFIVWSIAIDDLTETYNSIARESAKESYRLLILNLIEPAYRKLGWTDTGDHQRRKLREKLLRFAVQFNQTDALATSSRLFQQWRSTGGGSKLSPNLRFAVFMGGIKAFRQQAIDFLLVVYTRTTSAHLRKVIVGSVARAAGSAELERFMNRTMELSQAPDRADMSILLQNAAYNIEGHYVATRFMCDHWNDLYGRLNNKALGHAAQQLIAASEDPKELNYVKAFFRNMKPEKMAKVRGHVERGLQMAQMKNWWWNKHGEEIQRYMKTARDASPKENIQLLEKTETGQRST